MNKRKLGFLFIVLFILTLVLGSQINSSALCFIDNPSVTKITSIQPENGALFTEAVEIGFMEYGSYDGDGGISSGVAIKGEIAYVANGNKGLEIINISNPSRPKQIANILTQGDANDVFIYGTMAYVSQAYYGVALINISSPTSPIMKSTITPGGDTLDVGIHANILRIATANNGIHLYEVSDPENPLFISSWKGANEISGISVVTKYNCLAAKEGGLEIIDQTFPADPYMVGSWNDSTGVAFGVDSVTINDCKYAFLAYGTSGLAIINFTNP
ncbi:MAG: LVIVD repeat-containing protein [Candidatus Heimdallarchaeota archaeon]